MIQTLDQSERSEAAQRSALIHQGGYSLHIRRAESCGAKLEEELQSRIASSRLGCQRQKEAGTRES